MNETASVGNPDGRFPVILYTLKFKSNEKKHYVSGQFRVTSLPSPSYPSTTKLLPTKLREELIEIESLNTYIGKIPIAQRKKVTDWAKDNKDYLKGISD